MYPSNYVSNLENSLPPNFLFFVAQACFALTRVIILGTKEFPAGMHTEYTGVLLWPGHPDFYWDSWDEMAAPKYCGSFYC